MTRVVMPSDLPTIATLKIIVGGTVSSPNNPTVQLYDTGTDYGTWTPVTTLADWDKAKAGTSMGSNSVTGSNFVSTFINSSPSISSGNAYSYGICTTEEQAGFTAMNASLGTNNRYAALSISYLELYV